MRRASATLRALALVPLLAVGVDQARAVVWCGPDAQSCLEAAGRGWIGAWGIALVAIYSLALALLVVRGVRARPRTSFLRLWAVGTAGVAAACGGQALIATALGGQELGGGWLALLVLCVAAGALLALVLRTAPTLPDAPRPAARLTHLRLTPAPPALRRGFTIARQARGRAPPLLAI
ncbi:MAG TPA: hypothetical protein VFX51_21010 [Solirubrobacteraceae bacterium]|nr:hypothetical protein [Solirubrobacteraceae bacterium]